MASFFIIKITGELLLATILKGLVINYPPVGGEGAGAGVKDFADRGLSWSNDYPIPFHEVLYIFMILTLPLSFPVH